MIEAIVVLLIVGIVAAVVAVRMSDTSAYDLASQVEVIKTHLRYAQIRAMNTNTAWGINFISATQYNLFEVVGSTPTARLLPGEDSTTVSLTSKKSGLTITSTTPASITFDGYGSPFLNSATTSSTITTNTNGGGTITVTQNTGFIP